jgi:hypothetical protein
VLIPRSILKRNNPGNLVKDKRLEEATRDYYRYQAEQEQIRLMRTESTDDVVGKYDALFGKNLHPFHALLSPKIASIIRAPRQEQQLNEEDLNNIDNLIDQNVDS